VLEFLRAIPPPILVPIIMLFAGIEDFMKVIVIVSGCVWPILLNTVEGVRAIDEVLVDTSRVYKVKPLRHLTIQAASPQIMTGARQALAIGIILMVISEMVAANNGLGFTVVQFQRGFQIPDMWSGELLLGLIGVALAGIFRLAERAILGWYHGSRDAGRR
jgi:ABC-type nitrate/sulfonate/bicarbonate transport system permease component